MNGQTEVSKRRRGRPISRGFNTVDTGHPAGPCWIWNGYKDSNGYGMLARKDYAGYAHRFYYEQVLGPIPAGKQLDHTCRITSCVNPLHLEPVSPAQNVRRSRVAKLTEEKVRAIRDLWGRRGELGLIQRDIGKVFGVTQAQVSYIVNHREWRDIH